MINIRPFKEGGQVRRKKKIGNLQVHVNRIKVKRLACYSVAREYNFREMETLFKDKQVKISSTFIGCKCIREFNEKFLSNLDQYKFINPFEEVDTLKDDVCYIFLFNYGVAVFWNMTELEEKSIISELKPYEIRTNIKYLSDYISYEEPIIEDQPLNLKTYINNDLLLLCGKSFEEKLAVSYAKAQSGKLDYFENNIDFSIEEARTLADELAKNGQINLDHYNLNKKIGSLLLKKNEINLDTDILDVPDYFWNNDKYQAHFTIISKYLEISKRTGVINHRLNIISVIYILEIYYIGAFVCFE